VWRPEKSTGKQIDRKTLGIKNYRILSLCLFDYEYKKILRLVFGCIQLAFCRKIVIATNIAESSVTIDDIVYVIDCGRAKIKMFDPKRNFATLRPEWISQGIQTL
jgi:hypothetical protein